MVLPDPLVQLALRATLVLLVRKVFKVLQALQALQVHKAHQVLTTSLTLLVSIQAALRTTRKPVASRISQLIRR